MTSSLCAPVSPDGCSRTCEPSLQPWWRTEQWWLLILWVSKHACIFMDLYVCFFPHLCISNQRHVCQVFPQFINFCYCHNCSIIHLCPFYLLCVIKLLCTELHLQLRAEWFLVFIQKLQCDTKQLVFFFSGTYLLNSDSQPLDFGAGSLTVSWSFNLPGGND